MPSLLSKLRGQSAEDSPSSQSSTASAPGRTPRGGNSAPPTDAARAARREQAEDRQPDDLTEIPKAGWKDILKRSFKEFKDDDVTDRAAALTYYGVLSIFPGMLVLISLIGLSGKNNVNSILSNLNNIAPGGVNSFLHTVIQQVQGRSTAAGFGAIIGLVLAVWSASGYVAGFMRAGNAIYEIPEGRPIYRTIPVRLGTTIACMIILVIAALMVLVTGPIANTVGNALGIGSTLVTVWNIAKWPVLVILVSFMFSLLYWATPNAKQPGFKWITPGGVLAVIVWLITSGLFGLYVSFSGSYNKTYGSLATVIIFLVWLWISNIAILLGMEFNAESERQRNIEAGMPADLEPFVELRSTKKLDPDQKERIEEAAQVRERTMSDESSQPPADGSRATSG
jgi:membrane protein